MNLVVNRSKERKNKLRKKIENGDVFSLENYYECVMFGLQGCAKLDYQENPTRGNSLHDVNLNEVRDFILVLMGKKLNIPKYFKMKNTPFVRKIVHIHISDVPAAVNANTIHSTGGSKALIAGLELGEARCIRVDREIEEHGHSLPYKLLTVSYTKAAEYCPTIPVPSSCPLQDSSRQQTSGTENSVSEISTSVWAGVSAEERQTAQELAQYVLTPAQWHLWGYDDLHAPSSTQTPLTDAENDGVAVDAKRSRQDSLSEVAAKQARTAENEAVGVRVQEQATAPSMSYSEVKGSAAHLLPESHNAALQILRKLNTGSTKADGTLLTTLAHGSADYRTVCSSGYKSSNHSSQEDMRSVVLVAAVDCEMCGSDLGEELTRVSVLDRDGAVLLDCLVRPAGVVLDYRTQYSGVSADMLQGVTTTLQQVQVALLRLIPAEAILIGHSLDCDLRALHLWHARCVDTAVIFPHPRGYPMRLKLRKLAEDYLQQRIQCHGDKGHDSTEDAKAALQLALLKAAKGPLFGVRKPDLQRCALLGVLDEQTTASLLVWQQDATELVPSTLPDADGGQNENSDDAVLLPAGPAAAGPDTGADSVVRGFVGGNAELRSVSCMEQAVCEVCAHLAGDAKQQKDLQHEIRTTDDKAAGAISSWVPEVDVGPERKIELVKVSKSQYVFANLVHPVAPTETSVQEAVDFAVDLKEKIKRICDAVVAGGAPAGSTLLLITAQDSAQSVMTLLQRRRVLSRATLSTAMWTPAEELQLRELRKHNLAYMGTKII